MPGSQNLSEKIPQIIGHHPVIQAILSFLLTPIFPKLEKNKNEKGQVVEYEVLPELDKFLSQNGYSLPSELISFKNETGKYIFNCEGYCFTVIDPKNQVFLIKKIGYYGKLKGVLQTIINLGAVRDGSVPTNLVFDKNPVAGMQSHLQHFFVCYTEQGILKENAIPVDIEFTTNPSEDPYSDHIFSTVLDDPTNIDKFVQWHNKRAFE